MASQKTVRIGNVSGATGDARHAMQRMAEEGNVDIITGDWLSEMNIAWNAITKAQDPSLGYEAGFLDQLEDSIDTIVTKKIKVITNAGALNTIALRDAVEQICRARGHSAVVVAAVLGDDVTGQVIDRDKQKLFRHLDDKALSLDAWGINDLESSSAAAYIGAWGIVEALKQGADIVICGRVTDASPVIGAAAWWYGWHRDHFNQLAGALIAGHLIECGPYVTGANFSGFKDYLDSLIDLAFPIAEILPDGSCFITKPEQRAGVVTRFNVTAQLLYELQGELYLNSDVVADIRAVQIADTTTPNRVRVYGGQGYPPPPTTKVMIAAHGGYQAEAMYFINGLDVMEKAQVMKQQLEGLFRGNQFSKLSIELYGSEATNPPSQAAGTVMLRVFAQARKEDDISPTKFKLPIYSLRMQSYPGYHMNLDFRTMEPKRFMELFPSTILQSAIDHHVVIKSQSTCIPPPLVTAEYPFQRPSYETACPANLFEFGPTKAAPFGSIVHGRSGDKANNSNIGFFVRNADEYPWLQSMLTVERLKQLFGDDWVPGSSDRRIERCEFPHILAVHFRVLNFLDGGIASSSRIDGLGKGVAEYLRSRYVEIPVKFLERGLI